VGSNGVGPVFAGDPLSVQQLLNPFPSFGFDFEHLTAINRDANIKALIDPATQAEIALAERRMRHRHPPSGGFIFLEGGGAYALPLEAGGGVNPDDTQTAQDSESNQGQGQAQGASQDAAQQASQESQRPIIIVQQAGQGQSESDEARLAEERSASLPDEGEFTLILRSGQEIEAVAFTRVNDRIVYITINGGRRTVAVREVDIDATVRLNQEHGTPLQIPL
jgi:hypothetical protein